MQQIKLLTDKLAVEVHEFLSTEGEKRDSGYLSQTLMEQEQGLREFYIIYHNSVAAGFCQYNRRPKYQPFRSLKIPEIQDLFIGSIMRQQGLATVLIRHCEEKARGEGHDLIGIGVAVSASFGKAQRLYTKLGYQPDGAGVVYEREAVRPGQSYPVDDELCLMMIKDLSQDRG